MDVNKLDDYADLVAKKARTDFLTKAYEYEDVDIGDGELHGIGSPIERILLWALLATQQLNNIPDDEPNPIQPYVCCFGIDIEPQFRVGKYKIDFKISNYETIEIHNKKTIHYEICAGQDRTVLVECDSQEWHERTEKERRYEKARDRYLAKKGFTVFHYTGKEILEDPFAIAEEIFAFIGYYLEPIS